MGFEHGQFRRKLTAIEEGCELGGLLGSRYLLSMGTLIAFEARDEGMTVADGSLHDGSH